MPNRIIYQTLALIAVAVFLSSCASRSIPSSDQDQDAPSDYSTNTPKESDYEAGDNKGLTIAKIAQAMVGVDYQYGGHNPEQGFDCSGLVYYSHTQVGEQVPRVSYAQLAASDEISMDDLRPGDLLFYRINGSVSHVGIYIGHGQFVHAPSSGKQVRVSSMANVYFKPRLVRAGRLYRENED